VWIGLAAEFLYSEQASTQFLFGTITTEVIMSKKTQEKWKTIPGYEGYYEASDLGRIRGLDRIVPHKIYGSQPIKGRILKPTLRKSGYSHVCLRKYGKAKYLNIHSIVLLAFVGPLKKGYEAMHLERVQVNNNNSLSNLRYGSKQCNRAFMIDDGTVTIGENHPMAKLNEANVSKIKKLIASRVISKTKIGRMFNVYSSTIGQINRGETWGWVK